MWWTLSRKKKQEEQVVKTYGAIGSKVKLTTKSGNDYVMDTDQNMIELLDNIHNTKGFIFNDINWIAVKASEIESVEYLHVGGQDE